MVVIDRQLALFTATPYMEFDYRLYLYNYMSHLLLCYLMLVLITHTEQYRDSSFSPFGQLKHGVVSGKFPFPKEISTPPTLSTGVWQ